VDQGGSNPHFGDFTDLKDVRKAVDGVEGVGHLTFMPPLDPRWTQLWERVEMGGANNPLKALKAW
jgi:hypothetical protein